MVSTIFGVFFGLIAAIRRGKWVDSVVTFLSYIGLCVPVFLLGFVLIYIFGLKLRWLPIVGYTSPWKDFSLSVKQAIMPVICLAVVSLGGDCPSDEVQCARGEQHGLRTDSVV